jgi:membrane glycosyltransferase
MAPFWKIAIRQYNLVAPNPFTHLLSQKVIGHTPAAATDVEI